MSPVPGSRIEALCRRAFLWVGLVVCLIASGAVWSSCSDGAERVGSSAVPAESGSLSELWSRTASEWNADLSDATLTHFMALWDSEGALQELRVLALTGGGLEVSVWAETSAADNATLVHTGLMEWSGQPYARYRSSGSVPSVLEVFRSIDAVGIEGLASAVSLSVADGEFFTLWLSAYVVPQGSVTLAEAYPGGANGGRHYSVKEGTVTRLDDTTLLSAVALSEHLCFAKAKRNWDGAIQGGVDDSIVHVYVR